MNENEKALKLKINELIKDLKGDRIYSEALLLGLQSAPSKPLPFTVSLREYFLKYHQELIDLWQEISRNTLSGKVQFCSFALIGYSIEELLLAFFLCEHGYFGPSQTHLRAVLESLDLIELFNNEEEYATLWTNEEDPKKIWNKLKPGEVRKNLNRDGIFQILYSNLSESGSHPTFTSIKQKYQTNTAQPTEDSKPKIRVIIGGNTSSPESLSVHTILPLFLLAAIHQALSSFEEFIDKENAVLVFRKAISDCLEYYEKSFFELLDHVPECKVLHDSIRRSFTELLEESK